MSTPKISRPKFPKGYADKPASTLTWDWVAEQLTLSKHYWLCSVRPDGRPHAVPRWGVFMDEKFYYDGSPETRHAQNLISNSHVSLHLENGEQAIILEGVAAPAEKPEPAFARRLAQAIGEKYAAHGYKPEPSQWDEGGLFVFAPRQCIAWSVFYENPTKFVFE
jgi:hypothetical protein